MHKFGHSLDLAMELFSRRRRTTESAKQTVKHVRNNDNVYMVYIFGGFDMKNMKSFLLSAWADEAFIA